MEKFSKNFLNKKIFLSHTKISLDDNLALVISVTNITIYVAIFSHKTKKESLYGSHFFNF